eukprot:gb/GEZN01016120.1/.p1 GENE.gb/GEZN01016120.1/~~gb/GEZN01016120.1/.p1  ORF type:complete len:118 (+),score=9.90 gb/GEZN01016120.1/:357-710(+)
MRQVSLLKMLKYNPTLVKQKNIRRLVCTEKNQAVQDMWCEQLLVQRKEKRWDSDWTVKKKGRKQSHSPLVNAGRFSELVFSMFLISSAFKVVIQLSCQSQILTESKSVSTAQSTNTY